ncbi:hypothetical protein Hanom_Chr16g01423461 [Helianthus anomalus]
MPCLTPRQHLPKQKQVNRRLTTAPCPADTGVWSSVCRKDKAIEASISQHGGVPSSTRSWSTLRFVESKQILIIQIRFCTRVVPSGHGGVWS